jgi:NAD(P)-dependent dehydrogenase (short-subunit alcohol dehydrogenase family)
MGNGGAAASWFGGCALQAPRPAGVGDVRPVARQYGELAGKDPDVARAEMLRIVKQLLPLDARTRRAGELPRPVTRAEFELAVDALLRFYVSGRHTDESSMARAVDRAWSRLGGIDMLVNNAGIGMRTVNPRFMTHPQGFWEVPVGGFRAVIETNLTGYFLVAQEVTPRMLAAGGGRIVNISMSHSTMHRAGFVPYGPSRAGSEALSRIMAADLRDTAATVNLLLPGGATVTGMLPIDAVPEGQGFLEPAVMGPPIVWLASNDAAGVHDERIVAVEFEGWRRDRNSRR